MRAQRTSDDLEQMTAQKMALERDVTELQNDIHQLKANEEAMVAEKWELSAANADLQNRMQTMAITYMQVHLMIQKFLLGLFCTPIYYLLSIPSILDAPSNIFLFNLFHIVAVYI